MENEKLNEMLAGIWDSLTDEQKEKAKECKTPDELIKLAGLIITITKAAACAKRVQSVLDGGEGMQGEHSLYKGLFHVISNL